MKKFSMILALLALVFVSCGEKKEEATDKKAKTEKAAAKQEVSAEMTDFISGFNGDYKVVEAALAKHGANKAVIDHDMGSYNLKAPKITAQKGSIYTLVCESGMVTNTYEITWKDGKITEITGG